MSTPGVDIIALSSDAVLLSYDEHWDHARYVERFGESLLKHCRKIDAARWAIIDDISNWPVKPPNEIRLCRQITEKLVVNGLNHVAVCGSDLAISKWIFEQVVPDRIELQFFNHLDEAKQWVESLGYDVEFVS
ncbi:MAG: hypothetical protein HWE26_15975 [Alteromonadaceae bacterium]|nr:hypothetical protein [Alteromonadaceae bacterium]